MPIESAADRVGLLADDGDLALFASITAATDSGPTVVHVERNVLGLFDRAYFEINNQEGFRPVFLIVDEEATYLKHNHHILLKGHVYSVKGIKPDGEGFTQIRLHLLGPFKFVDEIGGGGYQYVYPFDYGQTTGISGPDADPDNPRLMYPYTVDTYLDFDTELIEL